MKSAQVAIAGLALAAAFLLGRTTGAEVVEGTTAVAPVQNSGLPADATSAENPVVNTWKVAELTQRRDALSGSIRDDGSARETLADYGNYRFRHLHRVTDGLPEQHGDVVDVVIVTSGSATMVFGGTIVNPRGSPEETLLGDSIRGGEERPLAAGDVVHIPIDVPHAFLVPVGGHFTYVLVKFPPT
jgi:mannose-6-phosphate isomerase-like protein (cupin superfamily)